MKQRIKQLLYEHQAEVVDAKTDEQVSTKLRQEAYRTGELELKTDRRDLAASLRESQLANEEFLRTLRLEQDRAITELRLEFERETRELQSLYEDRTARMREEMSKVRGGGCQG